MAINFGDTIMEGGITPSVAVQSPVQDNSGAILGEGLAGVAQTVGKIAGTIFNQQGVDAKAKVLTAYENELLDLADAIDQGAMDRDEAMLNARQIRRSYLSNSPGLQSDFDKVWTSVVDTNGMGTVIRTGTMEEQAQEARNTEALKLGYTPQEYDVFQARARQATALNQELDIIKANGGVVTETMRNQSLNTVVGLADAAFPAAQKQINEAMRAIEANPAGKAEIISNLNVTMGQNIAQLQSMSGNADAAFLVTPIQGLLDTFNKWGSGEIENSVLEAGIKNTQLQYAAMYANDPTLGPVIAQSKLLNDLGLAQTQLGMEVWSPEAIKKLREINDTGTVNIVDGSEGSNRFSDNLKRAAGTITSASDPALIQETMDAYNAVIDGAYVNERSAKDGALGFKDTVEMLGSNEYGNLISVGGQPTAQHADKIVQVLQDNYEKELVPAIQKYWESVPIASLPDIGTPGANAGGINNVPMSELLQPVWNGSVVEFVPAEAYRSNPRVVSLAAGVNSGSNSIGIPLNNLIKAYANVTGTDAKTIWENDFQGRLFNLGLEQTDAEGNPVVETVVPETEDPADSTFTIGQFNPDSLEPVAEYTSQASSLTEAVSAQLPPIDPAYTDVDGVDYASYLPSIRASESGGNDSARNPTSTATGRYQFLKSTWNDLANRYPNSGITPQGRLDPQQQEVAIRLFTAENARLLQRKGIGLNNGTLYAAHFLGAGDAAKVLSASDGLVSDYVPARVVSANSFLRGMTVEQFKAWAARKGNA